MKLVVIGSGYVGLVSGTCLARFGNTVVCVDTDKSKVKTLSNGTVPFYEPGLSEMMVRNMNEGRLSFSSDLKESLDEANVCFITVGTPSAPDGSANLAYVESAAREIGRVMSGPLLVAVKSTVPVGTNAKVRGWVTEELHKRKADFKLSMASNPEFLREGAAVHDFEEPDRVVIGTENAEVAGLMKDLYSYMDPSRLIMMDIPSAEMTKYASNAMLATRISFMNEIANICERVGANVDSVRQAMGRDSRIGSKFLFAGCGYGGSCFPKDVRAIRDFAKSSGYVSQLMTAVDEVNERQKDVLFEKLAAHFGSLAGLTIAVWGLAFKPKTSDTREATAHVLIRRLLEAGAHVQAHDPRAVEETRRELGEHQGLLYVHDSYDAVNGADALVLVTEWDIYKQPDFERIKKLLKAPVIVDGRNMYSLSEMKRQGFDYYSIGRTAVLRDNH